MTASDNGLGSLNISWSLGFIEEIPVNFILTAINLGVSSAKPIVISGIKDQFHVFSVQNHTCADVYSFQVAAMAADVESSNSSATVTRSIPSTPDIAAVENAVEHSLTKITDNEFKLIIKVKVCVFT